MQTIVDADGDVVRTRQTVIIVHAPPPHVVSVLVCLYHELLIAYLLIVKCYRSEGTDDGCTSETSTIFLEIR